MREIRAHDPGQIELSPTQLGSGEICCHELGAAQIGIGQIRPSQVGRLDGSTP